MTVWIARDWDGDLWMYLSRPKYDFEARCFNSEKEEGVKLLKSRFSRVERGQCVKAKVVTL